MFNFFCIFEDSNKKKWSPLKLNLNAFWESDNVLLNASAITTFIDKTGNGFDLTQTVTAAKQPAYNTGGAGGKPYARSDGIDDTMGNTGNVFPAGDFTMFLICASVSGGNTGEWLSHSVSGGNEDMHFYGGTETQFRRVSTGPVATLTARKPSLVVYTASGLDEAIYIDNAAPITTIGTRVAGGNRQAWLFGGGAASAFPRKFDFYAAGIKSGVLNSTQLQKLWNFGRSKYLLTP